MNKEEVEKTNQKIETHNKFSFNKKLMPKYKKVVPLSHAIIYFIVSAMFFAIPLVLLREPEYVPFQSTKEQLKEIERRSDMAISEEKIESESDEMKKKNEKERAAAIYFLGTPEQLEEMRIRREMEKAVDTNKPMAIKKVNP